MERPVYPGSFIWRRINQKWLVSRTASAMFALSAFLIVGFTAAFSVGIESRNLNTTEETVMGIGGALCAFGVFFLWGGMWRYWMDCDSASFTFRRFWFCVLAIGLCYGAIVYYLFVYLPRTWSHQVTHTEDF